MSAVPLPFQQLDAQIERALDVMPPSPERDAFAAHLATHEGASWRDGPPDHFTAAGLVFDRFPGEPGTPRVLLVLHRKAALWLQPGGHFEAGDHSVPDTAVREVEEETGIELARVYGTPVSLHHHQLGASFGRCRSHLDLRIAMIAAAGAQPQVSDESEDVAWWPMDAFPEPTERELPGIFERAWAQLQQLETAAAALGGH